MFVKFMLNLRLEIVGLVAALRLPKPTLYAEQPDLGAGKSRRFSSMLKKTSIVAMACVLAGSMLFAGCGGGEKKAAPKAEGNKLIIYTSMKLSLIHI